MHPEIILDKPGICPECGMNLIKVKGKPASAEAMAGKHAGHSTEMFLRKFWVSLILAIPVVLYSRIFQTTFNWQAPAFPGSNYIPLLLGSIVFFYGGWIFLRSAFREIKGRQPGMMTLIAVAISAAYFYSVYAAFFAPEHTLFWELTTLITIMLLGHWLEMRAVAGTQGALKELSKLIPDRAEVIDGTTTKEIPISELKEGDLVFVRPGGRIPADGLVIEGKSEANESMMTGESAPVPKYEGSEVIAGTTNGDGSLKIRVAKVGELTFLAGVMRLVEEAQSSKSKLQILSDRAAFYLTVIALVSGTITFITWLLVGAFDIAVERMVAVLVIACPHALGLAVPLVASISTTLAARNGFLVRQRLALELARKIDVVLFDKTGTLTKGEYGVTDIWPIEAKDKNEVLQYAASVDAHSEHFISKAIVKKAEEEKIELLEIEDFIRLPGKGVRGRIKDNEISVGGQAIKDELNLKLPPEIEREVETENKKGKTIIYAAKGEKALGALALADLIRDESREAVKLLKEAEIKVAMITGDSENVARWVAEDLGIDEYFAKVLPEEKSKKVKLLQERGYRVAMVGDGINDAPALTQADLGIAIGAGTNVAIESAGIILVRNDPRDIPKIVRLSRETYRKMIQNLFWATGYNVVALPLAAGVLATKGIILQPALAALFMSLSTVIVAINAMLLRRKTI